MCIHEDTVNRCVSTDTASCHRALITSDPLRSATVAYLLRSVDRRRAVVEICALKGQPSSAVRAMQLKTQKRRSMVK